MPAVTATASESASGKEPANLDLTIQIVNLARDWQHLGELVPALGTEGATELLRLDVDTAARAALGEVLAAAVDLSSSIDMTVASPAPDASASVVSVKIKDFEHTRRRLENDFDLVPLPGGGLELRPKASGHHGVLLEQSVGCGLHRNAGSPEGRLICGEEGSIPEGHVSYLLFRAEQPVRTESSVVMHVPLRRWREFTGDLVPPEPEDTPEDRLGAQILNEVFNDIDRITIDATLGHGRSEVALDLGISSARSVLSSFLLTHASERPLPDTFWDTPRDALIAVQWEGMAPGARRDDVAALMLRFAGAESNLDPAGRDALAKAHAQALFRGGPLWLVSGCDLDRASSALRDYLGNASTDQALVAAESALSGWTMLGFPDPLDHWKAALRAQIDVWKRYSLARPVTPALHAPADRKQKPSARSARSAPPAGSVPPAPVWSGAPTSPELVLFNEIQVTAAQKLPPGTLHFVYESFPNTAYRPPPDSKKLRVPSTQHWLLLEKGGHTWICFSASEAVCAEHLRTFARGGAGTLRDRSTSDLTQLLQARGAVLGFVSPAGLVWFTTQTTTLEEVRESKSALAALTALPNGGRTPWTLLGTSNARPGATRGNLRLGLQASSSDLLSSFAALAAANDD